MSKPSVTGRVSSLGSVVIYLMCISNVFAQTPNQTGQSNLGEFTLSGTIENAENPYLYLLYESTPGVRLKDSSRIIDNKFQFKGFIREPTKAILRENPNVIVNGKVIADETNLNFTDIFLEEGIMTTHLVHNEFKSIRLIGSKTQEDYDKLNGLNAPFSKQYVALRNQLDQAKVKNYSQQQIDSLNQLSQQAIRGMRSVSFQFILNNPDSYIGANELSTFKNRWPLDTVKYLFDNLSQRIKNSIDGQKINEVIRAKEGAAVGAVAYDFSGLELNGQSIKLSDFRGKYLLIDFWGSWCAPCRKGNPRLIELYNKYKDKNFEIIGVASQDEEPAWRKAVEKDKIGIWKHIIDTDTKSRGLAIAGKYGVYSFPTKFLVDKNGKIIGRFSGDEEKKLDDLIAKTLK